MCNAFDDSSNGGQSPFAGELVIFIVKCVLRYFSLCWHGKSVFADER